LTAFNNKLDWDSQTEWLTPPELIAALGQFDLDPCAPVSRPWDMAKHHFTIQDDAFKQDWGGASVRKFMNPPYQEPEAPCKRVCKKKRCVERGHHVTRHVPGTADWVKRLADSGNGVALIFARTETGIFFPHVWHRAAALFFFDTRLTFYHVDGTLSKLNSGAPSCLVAYGEENAEAVRECERGIEIKTRAGKAMVGGKFISLLPARAYAMPQTQPAFELRA
jgi:hypothetical protein